MTRRSKDSPARFREGERFREDERAREPNWDEHHARNASPPAREYARPPESREYARPPDAADCEEGLR